MCVCMYTHAHITRGSVFYNWVYLLWSLHIFVSRYLYLPSLSLSCCVNTCAYVRVYVFLFCPGGIVFEANLRGDSIPNWVEPRGVVNA